MTSRVIQFKAYKVVVFVAVLVFVVAWMRHDDCPWRPEAVRSQA